MCTCWQNLIVLLFYPYRHKDAQFYLGYCLHMGSTAI